MMGPKKGQSRRRIDDSPVALVSVPISGQCTVFHRLQTALFDLIFFDLVLQCCAFQTELLRGLGLVPMEPVQRVEDEVLLEFVRLSVE